jgi:hypothetical protein
MMTLTDEWAKIKANPKKIKTLTPGNAKTIHEFFDQVPGTFFKDPAIQNAIRDWHKLLVDYVNEPDAVYIVCAFAGYSQKVRESQKGDECRRGFLTLVNHESFAYLFVDNDMVAYVCRMAMDGYCPSLADFKKAMQDGSFPVHFRRPEPLEQYRSAYDVQGKLCGDPGFSHAGYKIAHLVDKSNHIWDGKQLWKISELAEHYGFTRGKYSEWKKEYVPTLGRKTYVRHQDVKPGTREVLQKLTLMFFDPLNYVLTPKGPYKHRPYQTFCAKGLENADIAEYPPFQIYSSNQMASLFPTEYPDFIRRIFAPNWYGMKNDGSEIIDIVYSKDPLDGDVSTPNPAGEATKARVGRPTAPKGSPLDPYIHYLSAKKKPNTVAAYAGAIRGIMKGEGLDFPTLLNQAGSLLKDYQQGGAKAALGAKGHGTWRNALACLNDYSKTLAKKP